MALMAVKAGTAAMAPFSLPQGAATGGLPWAVLRCAWLSTAGEVPVIKVDEGRRAMAASLFLGARKADKASVWPLEPGAFMEHYGACLAF